MRHPIKKIIICGGGSSGWITASVLSNQHPNLEFALVESPNIPVIGVGESTLGSINSFLKMLGLSDKDWMEYCQATYKLGIKFTDFYKKGEEFYYPFGIKDQQNTTLGISDWFVKKALYPETSINDFYESFYSVMPFIYESKIYDNHDGQLPGFSWDSDVAYHLDAIAFGQFLKEKVAIPNGVVHIVSEIKEVSKDHEGYIDGLLLENGDVLAADLYIDCTGFKSLLLGNALDVGFESYRDWLPNNKAWVCHVPYTDPDVEMENVTNCTAHEYGWVWNIPLYNRIGSGFVYSDRFISDKEALERFKKYLNSDKMKIQKDLRSDEIDNFELITIKNGVHTKAWHKNVVGIGLSYGFIEPLESTGLLSTQEGVLRLSELLFQEQINRYHIDSFNYVIKAIMEGFKYFVTWHFSLSSRRDSEYWRERTEYSIMDPRMEDTKYLDIRTTPMEIAYRMLQSHDIPGDFGFGGMPDILVGSHWIPSNKTQLEILRGLVESRGSDFENYSQQVQDYWDQKKDYINILANDAVTHYKYLSDNIYKSDTENVEDNLDSIEEENLEN